jgi:hypothetical protein
MGVERHPPKVGFRGWIQSEQAFTWLGARG